MRENVQAPCHDHSTEQAAMAAGSFRTPADVAGPERPRATRIRIDSAASALARFLPFVGGPAAIPGAAHVDLRRA
jgi:hypothetical protein